MKKSNLDGIEEAVKKEKPRRIKNPKTMIAYYYDSEGERNCAVFVIDKKATEWNEEFLKYANDYNDWEVEEDDIEDIYPLNLEYDKNGFGYKINIKEQ